MQIREEAYIAAARLMGASAPYLVMPFCRGESLQARLDRTGPLPVTEVLRLGSQIAAGLAAGQIRDPGRMIVLMPIEEAYALATEGQG